MPYKDPEAKRRQAKAWSQANKQKRMAYQRKYRDLNKDKVKAAARKKYAADKVKLCAEQVAYQKEWRKLNPDKHKEQLRRHYERKRAHYSTKMAEYRDRLNPARPIRRALRAFRRGDLPIDELIKQSRRQVDELNGRSERVRRDLRLRGGTGEDSGGTS